MKTISSGLQTHLQQEVTSLATCLKLTRIDATEFFFTDHDENIPFDGDIYEASSSYKRTAIQTDSSLTSDNLNIEGILDSDEISLSDLRAGLFDYAEIRMFIVNFEDLTQLDLKLLRGRLGEATMTEQGFFRAELRGLNQNLSQVVGQLYSPECRADLGDAECKVPIDPAEVLRDTDYELGDFFKVSTGSGTTQEQYQNRIYEVTVAGTTTSVEPTYDTTVDNTTVDGTVTATARQAWTRHGEVDTVTDRKTFTLKVAFDEARAVDDWFNGGGLVFEDGDNINEGIEVRDWIQSTRELTLFFSAPFAIAVDTKVKLFPGCDKLSATCSGKFFIPGSTVFPSGLGNILNFRGEPHVPGQDELTRYPDAKSA